MSVAVANRPAWLHGPVPDVLLGAGVLSVLLAAAFAWQGGAGLSVAVPVVLLALVSVPHYGATLLRVYAHRSDRQAYFAYAVVATAALLAVFGVALVDRFVGSLLATVYLTWTGWHYSGQNYGIATMFLRRRGVDVDGAVRRAFHASFVLSYAIVFLVMHGQAAPIANPSEEIRFIPLALPPRLVTIGVGIASIAWLGATGAAFALLARRARRIGDLLPSAVLVVTQALWWSIPYLARAFGSAEGFGASSAGLQTDYFTWVALGHAAQYLWITSYHAKVASDWRGQGTYYGRVLLAGATVWTLPALLFAPGDDVFDWNFTLLLAATVNVHHFVLDGAIWKLRSPAISRILIDGSPEQATNGRSPWLWRIPVWGTATVCLALTLGSLVDRFYVYPKAVNEGRLVAAEASLDRQAWLGPTHAVERFLLARRFEAAGDLEHAAAQYAQSARLEPRVEPLRRLVLLHDRLGNAESFVRACDGLHALESIPRPIGAPPASTSLVPPAYRMQCLRLASTPHAPDAHSTGRLAAAGGVGVERVKRSRGAPMPEQGPSLPASSGPPRGHASVAR